MMEKSDKDFPPRFSVKSGLILLLLCLAGFFGNWFKLELFFNVDFLFGSFFVMLAVVLFGLPLAALVGFISASCSYLLWDHPWAILIFTAETVFVAYGNRRSPGCLVLLDTLFWLCLGMPMVWLFYHVIMHMPLQSTLLVALKQSTNGIFNTLFATIFLYVITFSSARKKAERPLVSFREVIFTAMITVTLVPVFIHMIWDVRGGMTYNDKDIVRRVTSVAESAYEIVETWIGTNHQTLIALADTAGDPGTANVKDLQRQVETLKLANPNLVRLGIADKHSIMIAHAPLIDENGRATLGKDMSDRPFIPIIKKSLKPMIPDAVISKIGPATPALPLVAPIVDHGRYLGYCGGVIDFQKLTDQIRLVAKNRWSEITILDREGRVVVSTANLFRPMQKFSRPAGGETKMLAGGTYHWVPKQVKGTSIMQRWKDSVVVKEMKLSKETPWTIIAESSLLPYLDSINQATSSKFLLLWGVILLNIPISHLLSKRIVDTLNQLQLTTTELPRKIAVREELVWPVSRVKELHSLIDNIHQVSDALQRSFEELTELNEDLEQRVEERTLELKKSEEKYSRIIRTANEGIWIVDTDLRFIYANQHMADMLGYAPAELDGKPISDLIFTEDMPDHQLKVINRKNGLSERYERRFVRKDGTVIWVQISAMPLLGDKDDFQGSFAMCTDITERKKAEEELHEKSILLEDEIAERQAAQEELCAQQQQLEELNTSLEQRIEEAVAELRKKDQFMITQSRQAAMGEMIGNIAHQWRQPLNALGLLLSNIQDAYEFNQLDKEYMEQVLVKGNSLISKMSITINDFRNFFRPDKEAVAFSAKEQIHMALCLIESSFKNDSIAIELDIPADLTLVGYPNEYSQVLLNLLSNAKEAIIASGTSNGMVKINLTQNGNYGCVTLSDNGGGIPASVMGRLFEPYFSTKQMGTGIGLYMSKMIIERNMNGSIEAGNTEEGAKFIVTTPLAKSPPNCYG